MYVDQTNTYLLVKNGVHSDTRVILLRAVIPSLYPTFAHWFRCTPWKRCRRACWRWEVKCNIHSLSELCCLASQILSLPNYTTPFSQVCYLFDNQFLSHLLVVLTTLQSPTSTLWWISLTGANCFNTCARNSTLQRKGPGSTLLRSFWALSTFTTTELCIAISSPKMFSLIQMVLFDFEDINNHNTNTATTTTTPNSNSDNNNNIENQFRHRDNTD